jgi:hypothetical protein
MSIYTSMNRPEAPLSGIVLFPDAGSLNDMTPAMARQFGMAANAYVTDEGVMPGTVHAVGYDPQLAVDLLDLNHRGGVVWAPDEAGKARQRTILDEFGRLLKHEFDEQGIALHSLHDELTLRRIDFIAAGRPQNTLLIQALIRHIPDQRGAPVIPHVWYETEEGVLVATDSHPISREHPLSRHHLDNFSSHLKGFTVLTAPATLLPRVDTRATYQWSDGETQLVATGAGYQRTVSTSHTAVHTARFDIPGVRDSVLGDELAQLDAYNEAQRQEYEDNGQLPNSDVDPVWMDGQIPHAGYIDRTELKRRSISRLLDPIEDSAWRSRLS